MECLIIPPDVAEFVWTNVLVSSLGLDILYHTAVVQQRDLHLMNDLILTSYEGMDASVFMTQRYHPLCHIGDI